MIQMKHCEYCAKEISYYEQYCGKRCEEQAGKYYSLTRNPSGKCRTDCSVFHFVHHSHLPTQSRRYLALLNLIFIIAHIFPFSKIFFRICLTVFLGNQADEHIG